MFTVKHELPKKLSIQYLFHLKALEYAKKYVNKKIKDYKNGIQPLTHRVEYLESSIRTGPTINKPSAWYSYKWIGKWVIFSVLIAIVIIILSTNLLTAIVLLLLILLIVVILYFYSYNQNSKYLEQLEQYEVEVQRIKGEVEERIKIIEMLDAWTHEEEKLQNSLTNIRESRRGLYSVNYIPYQYRNLESIAYFYNQVKSSFVTLKELVLFESNRVINGYENIPNFIKNEDDMYSFPTVNRVEFWNSCSELVKEVNKILSESEGENLEQSMQQLIKSIEEGGLGVKYEIKGNVQSIVDRNDGILLNHMYAVEAEVDCERLKHFIDEVKRDVVNSSTVNHQDMLEKLDALKTELTRSESETKDEWRERISKRVLAVLGSAANVATITTAIRTFIGLG